MEKYVFKPATCHIQSRYLTLEMKIYFILLLLYPLTINSQNFEKTDLIGNWKFKEYILTRKMPQNTIINIGGGITKEFGKSTDLKFSDIKITMNTFQENDYESDFWKISNYEIIYHMSVPKNDLEFYKKHSVGIIEKLENGKYYFKNPMSMKILSLNKNQLIIEDYYYNIIYEKE